MPSRKGATRALVNIPKVNKSRTKRVRQTSGHPFNAIKVAHKRAYKKPSQHKSLEADNILGGGIGG